MIKWEHSIFALPFALCGAMLAARGVPTTHQIIWIVVAMVAARSAAMSFNRLADVSIDAANPRTKVRALPAGTLTQTFVRKFALIFCAIFVFAASLMHCGLRACFIFRCCFCCFRWFGYSASVPWQWWGL